MPENLVSSVKDAALMGILEYQPQIIDSNRCTRCNISPKLKVEYCSIGVCYKDHQYELQNPGRLAN